MNAVIKQQQLAPSVSVLIGDERVGCHKSIPSVVLITSQNSWRLSPTNSSMALATSQSILGKSNNYVRLIAGQTTGSLPYHFLDRVEQNDRFREKLIQRVIPTAKATNLLNRIE